MEVFVNTIAPWRSIFKGLSQDGGWADLKKTFAPLSLMTTYRMSLILAGSISLNSTFKCSSYLLLYVLHNSQNHKNDTVSNQLTLEGGECEGWRRI
jgi:hypothetical protein